MKPILDTHKEKTRVSFCGIDLVFFFQDGLISINQKRNYQIIIKTNVAAFK